MSRFHLATATLLASMPFAATLAHAQSSDTTVLVDTAIPENYDRDRNVSVLERPRPDYDQLGIRRGGFLILPQAETGLGATSNVYLSSADKKSDGYAYLAPSILARSDWSQDMVQLSGTGMLRRFFKQDRRNESSFNLRALGRKDIGDSFSLTGEAHYAKIFESFDSGAIDSTLAVLSSYNRSYFSGRAQYRSGQSRAILAIDRTAFTFADINLSTGDVSQADRDRVITRGTGEYQHALSPSISLYGQAGYGETKYSRTLFDGTQNRDSVGWRAIGGVNFDLAGFMRGKVGVGYIDRNYKSPVFRDTHGLSAEAVVEYFPSVLTTFGLTLSRTIEDSSVGNIGAFFQNRVQMRVDHELLNNLIVGSSAEYGRQKYVDDSTVNNYYRIAANARYLSSRFVSLNGQVTYNKRDSSTDFGGKLDDLRAQIGIIFRR
ncbi:outer membrane beta-barrel protein [Sphingobium sp.]|uniref:outer membrane beta-barrel protein n=1 Tax=Sphingobium sp. TaxID=1912891 RepID=UPI003BB53A58